MPRTLPNWVQASAENAASRVSESYNESIRQAKLKAKLKKQSSIGSPSPKNNNNHNNDNNKKESSQPLKKPKPKSPAKGKGKGKAKAKANVSNMLSTISELSSPDTEAQSPVLTSISSINLNVKNKKNDNSKDNNLNQNYDNSNNKKQNMYNINNNNNNNDTTLDALLSGLLISQSISITLVIKKYKKIRNLKSQHNKHMFLLCSYCCTFGYEKECL